LRQAAEQEHQEHGWNVVVDAHDLPLNEMI
jgi:hypothetical protein